MCLKELLRLPCFALQVLNGLKVVSVGAGRLCTNRIDCYKLLSLCTIQTMAMPNVNLERKLVMKHFKQFDSKL